VSLLRTRQPLVRMLWRTGQQWHSQNSLCERKRGGGAATSSVVDILWSFKQAEWKGGSLGRAESPSHRPVPATSRTAHSRLKYM
jgi:hypothetical protein